MLGKLSLWAVGVVVAGLMLPSQAMARFDAYTSADLNLRVGPGMEYGVIDVIPAGYPVDVLGCLDAYEWCDIEWDGLRGWVSARYLVQPGTTVYLPQYAPRIGVPIITFSFFSYHDRYYRDRPWYRERHGRWRGRDWRDRDRDRARDRDRDRDRDRVEEREERQEAERPRRQRDAERPRQREAEQPRQREAEQPRQREAEQPRRQREARPQPRRQREARPQPQQQREAEQPRRQREARPQREREARPQQGERTQRQDDRPRQGQRVQRQGNDVPPEELRRRRQ